MTRSAKRAVGAGFKMIALAGGVWRGPWQAAVAALLLLPLCAVKIHAASVTPTPSTYGRCQGHNVPYQFNSRPLFVSLLPVTTNSPIELRLCIGNSISVANVGLTALTIDISSDGGRQRTVMIAVFFALTRVPPANPLAGSTFTNAYTLSVSSSGCPSPWVYSASGLACVAPYGPACHSVFVPASFPYSTVRGSASGVQFGDTCAFGPSGRPTSIEGTPSRWDHVDRAS